MRAMCWSASCIKKYELLLLLAVLLMCNNNLLLTKSCNMLYGTYYVWPNSSTVNTCLNEQHIKHDFYSDLVCLIRGVTTIVMLGVSKLVSL